MSRKQVSYAGVVAIGVLTIAVVGIGAKELSDRWSIAGAASLVAATLLLGCFLWWTSADRAHTKGEVGRALLTGAILALAVGWVQLEVDNRLRDSERERQASDERQNLQLALDLRDRHGELTLEGRDLTGLSLAGKTLEGANLSETQLAEAVLDGARLDNAELEAADLRGASLLGVDMDLAFVTHADLRGATLTEAHLRGSQLLRVRAEDAIFRNALLTDAELYEAALTGADLRGANLRRAGLERAVLRGADLSQANLAGASLIGADLRGANLSRATLQHARFGRTLYDADTAWPSGFQPPVKRLVKR
jgi:uncharacterized protein YjbI with pentapeptide repeats